MKVAELLLTEVATTTIVLMTSQLTSIWDMKTLVIKYACFTYIQEVVLMFKQLRDVVRVGG